MPSTARHQLRGRPSGLVPRISAFIGRMALALLICAAMHGAASAKRITMVASPNAVLVHLAAERGYFRDQGLDVEVQRSESGPNSIKAVVEGHADIATSAETPFVIYSFERPDLRILATLSTSDTLRLIARGDRAIRTPRDLAGKRIGVTLGSVGEYLLARYLTLNAVQPAAATLVDLKPDQITERLVKGELDAGLTWEPFVRNAELALEDNVVTLPEQYDQYYHTLLTSTRGWLNANPSEARAILRALIAAETYAVEHPVEAKEIYRKLFDIGVGEIDYVWSLHNLYVSLPQALMFALELQAEWHIRRKLTGALTIPNYLGFIATDPLRQLRESSVGIVK